MFCFVLNKAFNKMYKATPTGTHYPRGIAQELSRLSTQPPARCSRYQSGNRSGLLTSQVLVDTGIQEVKRPGRLEYRTIHMN